MKISPYRILDGHKLLWHRERVEAWLAGERIAPITIDCALTTRCTYKCVYCYGTTQRHPGRQSLSRDAIFRFLDDAAEIGVKAISFVSDGESTCSPHLYDAILRGKANGLDMALGTNGLLLQRDRLEEILPALTYLRFNVSAAQEKRYTEIHGCPPLCYHEVMQTIALAVDIKNLRQLPVTIGLQMVFMPQFADQVLPLARRGKELGVDYTIIKHCSDDEQGSLGVNYRAYRPFLGLLEKAAACSTPDYEVAVKWSKIVSEGQRSYVRCYGPPFLAQFSGSGLISPCGMLFNPRFQRFWIGNLNDQSFKELWKSDRYWEVMGELASERFDARTMCGSLCVQHKVNEYLWELKQGYIELRTPRGDPPEHVNFV